MKTSLSILLLLIIFGISANGQTREWLWAEGALNGNVGGDQSMAIDVSGNIYVTGNFSGSTIIFGNDTLFNTGSPGIVNSMFLLKLDSLGNILWAKDIGKAASSVALGIDAKGNVYVTGSFDSTIIFGNDTLVNIKANTFIVKYSQQGNVVWAKNVGGSYNYPDAIAVDANGNCCIVGYFYGGSIFCGADTLSFSGITNSFVAKYDSLGNGIWAKSIGGNFVSNSAINIDSAGNICVTGGFSGPTASVGNITLNNNQGGASIYVIKYTPEGDVTWATNMSVNVDIFTTGICTDGNSNVYILGATNSDTLAFGNDTIFTNNTFAYDNFFIAKYDSSGNIKWAQSAKSYTPTESAGISADVDGNVYIIGTFGGNYTIIGNDSLFNNDTLDESKSLFIAKYDSSGIFIWVIGGVTGKGDADAGTVIKMDNAGIIYIAGSYVGPDLNFGSDTLPSTENKNIGSTSNIFIAKLSSTISGITNTPITGNSILVYPNPSFGQFYFKGINSGSTMEIYDMMGQTIYSSTVTGDNYLLNLTGQAKGMYIYRVTDKSANVQVGKIVLE